MKKTFRFLALSLMLICGTLSSFADVTRPTDGPDDGYTFTQEQGVVTYQVTGWNAKAKENGVEKGAYEISIVGLDYTGVTTKPTTLTIKTSFKFKYAQTNYNYIVTEIAGTTPAEGKSFYAQTQLTSVVFDNENGPIGDDQFTIKKVGDYAFFGCEKLATLTFTPNVEEIGKRAFQSTAITEFHIPAKCKTIGEYAFNNTEQLVTVDVMAHNGVLKSIDQKVFANSYVQTLDLTNAHNLEWIADDAFVFDESKVNNQLTTVILPAEKWVNTAKPFTDANNHKTPTLFKFIGTKTEVPADFKGTAFANCTALTEIRNFETSIVATINNGAFENCQSLPELYFPATATIASSSVDNKSAFIGCKSLETLKFADGWDQMIGGNVYISSPTALSALGRTQEQELAVLKTINFMGTESGIIAPYAFGKSDDNKALACSALATVTFGTTLENGTKKGIVGNTGVGALIGMGAFENCAELATVTFNGFVTAGAATDPQRRIVIGQNAFRATKIAAVDFQGFSVAGTSGVDPTVLISKGAFEADQLGSVSFGSINIYGTNEMLVQDGTFKSDLLTTATFGNIVAGAAGSKLTLGQGTGAVILPKGDVDKLATVTFGTIKPGTFVIDDEAFKSEALSNVTITGIETVDNINGTLTIDPYAFGYASEKVGNAVAKTVSIGTIKNSHKNGAATLTVNIGESAFTGALLQNVSIAGIARAKNGNYVGTTTVNIAASAFANTLSAALEENQNVKIDGVVSIAAGQDMSGTLKVNGANAFKGPQTKGSTFTATLGNLVVAPTIVAGAFAGPAEGTTTYTVGNIAKGLTLTGNIQKSSFVGSKDSEGNNTTDVTIGSYKSSFNVSGATFTNVKNATVGSWEVVSNTYAFEGVKNLKVLGNVTAAFSGDGGLSDGHSIVSLEIGGDVTDANLIQDFGSKVRSIKFADNAKVATGAVATGAFEKASDAIVTAGTDEKIMVVYNQEGTPSDSKAIFAVDAFNDANDDNKNVVLYTDNWSKVNIFQNKDIYPNGVYRLDLSTSSVVPGDDIEATCVGAKDNNYAYGKINFPAGTGKFAIDAETANNVTGVQVWRGTIDGETIRMIQLDIVDGRYWIDATEADQTFVVRVSKDRAEGLKVTANAVTAEYLEENPAETLTDDDWFDGTWAKKNALRFTATEISNQRLQNDSEFEKKGIFRMANPAKDNFAMLKINQYSTEKPKMVKNSLYVVTKVNIYASRLNVIWEGEDVSEEATAIKNIENVEENNEAIYNLQGVRVKNANKGIFIINGKKVIK